jgi:two-component system OmpR family response regulator
LHERGIRNEADIDSRAGNSNGVAEDCSIPDATPIALSKGEYALLLAFLEAPQRLLSREHLLQATRIHEDIFDRSIDVRVLRLRRKVETDRSAPRVIQTERGVGYVFALPVQPV